MFSHPRVSSAPADTEVIAPVSGLSTNPTQIVPHVRSYRKRGQETIFDVGCLLSVFPTPSPEVPIQPSGDCLIDLRGGLRDQSNRWVVLLQSHSTSRLLAWFGGLKPVRLTGSTVRLSSQRLISE